ncbi:MAG: hypothetical protein COS36_06815 [Candidatus Altarchaeum sp. CG03_land_8_20_14_0_80_32_618]|nr:MAG: hypothetical protein AUK59_03170 [Candidatus Altarchaeum sp. CG2_30_32_3053]PIV27145.1 MAG: hypothetical protein COS36_06815 [Candidatus Altarchaeum sp. CG03_land_8_20_14_0_80_32_618]PIZ30998.1 MAG: hypothetical protein COY41_03170 [Candidatus Altarchaeum sp. CG_4_10_14_0_8_um_filter_32_851]
MNKKILAFSVISLISLFCLLFLYFYSLENAKYYWDVDDGSGNIYAPDEYLADNPEKFKGKDMYCVGYVELKDGKIFIPYSSIFPTKEKIKTDIVNPEKFHLENGKCYGFKARITDIKTEDDVKVVEIYVIEKFQPLIDMPWTIFEILFNVPAVLIMIYLLLKLKLNFRKILIEAKS